MPQPDATNTTPSVMRASSGQSHSSLLRAKRSRSGHELYEVLRCGRARSPGAVETTARIANLWSAWSNVVMAVKEPPFTLERQEDSFEVRRYAARVVAETRVTGSSFDAAGNQGFRRLAGYIFGSNHARRSVAMTAPVRRTPRQSKLAMTAPVGERELGGRCMGDHVHDASRRDARDSAPFRTMMRWCCARPRRRVWRCCRFSGRWTRDAKIRGEDEGLAGMARRARPDGGRERPGSNSLRSSLDAVVPAPERDLVDAGVACKAGDWFSRPRTAGAGQSSCRRWRADRSIRANQMCSDHTALKTRTRRRAAGCGSENAVRLAPAS